MCRSSSAGTWVGSMFEADQRGLGGVGTDVQNLQFRVLGCGKHV
jgi:hypothetical protein